MKVLYNESHNQTRTADPVVASGGVGGGDG
jgi:hypothetical protein